MRYITGAVALGAALVLGTLATTAHAVAAPAQPTRTGGLYAPTALVLTVSQGESRATATVQRAVTLSCMPGRPAATRTRKPPAPNCARWPVTSTR